MTWARGSEVSEKAVLRITVHDLESGEQEVKEIPAGEYFILTTAPCHVSSTQAYPAKGTHVITVRERVAR